MWKRKECLSVIAMDFYAGLITRIDRDVSVARAMAVLVL